MDIVRLDLDDKKYYNLSDRFRRQLEFLGAKSYEERENIAKGDEILMDLNAWLEEYRNDESLREFFDEKRWAKLEGHNEGVEEGKNNKTIEIAKNLFKTNLTLEEIASSTNLTLEEIKKIYEETTTKTEK